MVAVVGVVVGLISDFEILSFGTWSWWWCGGGVDFRFRNSKLWHLVVLVVLMVGSISDFEILSFGTWWW